MAKRTRTVTKVVKKKWVPIHAPKVLNEQPVGEAYILEPKSLVGKVMKVNLMTIMNDIKKQNISVQLKIYAATPEKAQTEVIAFNIIPSSVRRLVRRGRSRVDYVVNSTTSNGKKIKTKLFIVTNAQTHNSIATKIRKTANYLFQEIAKKSTFEQLVKDIISRKVQDEIREQLRKIYPIRVCDIRSIELTKERFHSLKKDDEGEETKVEAKEAPAEESAEKPKAKKKAKEEPAEKAEEAPVEEAKEEVQETKEE